jgi:hypothetical protein
MHIGKLQRLQQPRLAARAFPRIPSRVMARRANASGAAAGGT